MKLLSSFLERYKRITPPDVLIRDSVVTIFEKRFAYVISRAEVRVQSRVVYIDCPALLKNEVSLNKKELLVELLSMISPHVVDDIR